MSDQHAADISSDLYYPDIIDAPQTSWLFSFSSLGYWSRQDGITRKEELTYQIEAYRILRQAIFTGRDPPLYCLRVLFNAMIYFLRYFQRRSYKRYHKTTTEVLCAFISFRVLETPRPVDDILKRGFNFQNNWDVRDKINQIEMAFMGDLCYDLILTNPFDILAKLMDPRKLEDVDREKVGSDTTKLIDHSVITQIYLLYAIDFTVACFLCSALIRRKMQLPENFFNEKLISTDINVSVILKFFEVYNELVSEIVPIRMTPYIKEYDFTHVTENSLKFVLRETNEFPESNAPVFELPDFYQAPSSERKDPPSFSGSKSTSMVPDSSSKFDTTNQINSSQTSSVLPSKSALPPKPSLPPILFQSQAQSQIQEHKTSIKPPKFSTAVPPKPSGISSVKPHEKDGSGFSRSIQLSDDSVKAELVMKKEIKTEKQQETGNKMEISTSESHVADASPRAPGVSSHASSKTRTVPEALSTVGELLNPSRRPPSITSNPTSPIFPMREELTKMRKRQPKMDVKPKEDAQFKAIHSKRPFKKRSHSIAESKKLEMVYCDIEALSDLSDQE